MTRRTIPALDLSRVEAARPLPLTALRLPATDPLTGHRGPSDGVSLAADAGPVALLAHLSRDEHGLILRGQVIAPDPETLDGALVHARADGRAALAAVTPAGEFALRGWAGSLRFLDIETEDGAWRLEWPPEDET